MHFIALYYRKECGSEGNLKKDILDLAKSINKESQEIVRVATSTAEACTDRIMKQVMPKLCIIIILYMY